MKYFDEQIAKEYIAQNYPDAQDVAYIDSGYENFIAVVD